MKGKIDYSKEQREAIVRPSFMVVVIDNSGHTARSEGWLSS